MVRLRSFRAPSTLESTERPVSIRRHHRGRMPETPASRLRQASKQIHLAEEALEDDPLSDDLQEAISIVEGVRGEISDPDEDS